MQKFEYRNMDNFLMSEVKNVGAFFRRWQNHQELSKSGKSKNQSDLYNIEEEAYKKSFANMYSDLEFAINKRKELATR